MTRKSWTLAVVAGCAALAKTLGSALAQAPAAVRGQKPVKVAAVDFIPAWGDLDGNVARLAQAVEKVAQLMTCAPKAARPPGRRSHFLICNLYVVWWAASPS